MKNYELSLLALMMHFSLIIDKLVSLYGSVHLILHLTQSMLIPLCSVPDSFRFKDYAS